MQKNNQCPTSDDIIFMVSSYNDNKKSPHHIEIIGQKAHNKIGFNS